MADMNATEQLGEILNISTEAVKLVAKLEVSFEAHAPLVTHAFLIRQIEFGYSVKLLIDHGLYPGAAIAARTMLEGASALHWVLVTGLEGNGDIKEQEKRAGRWRGFAWVEDKQFTEDQRNFGIRPDPDLEERIEKGYTDFLNTFKKPPKKFKSGWKLDDSGKSIEVIDYFQKELPEDIKDEPYKLYQRLSSYVHWSPHAFNLRFSEDKNRWQPVYPPSSKVKQISLLASISLAITTNLAASYFELSILPDVDRYIQNFPES